MTFPADAETVRETPGAIRLQAEAWVRDYDDVTCEREAGRVILSLLDTLERIVAQQPKTLETLQKHHVVFDGPLGNDPKNWQHVAFSIYTDLCEVDMWARQALEGVA